VFHASVTRTAGWNGWGANVSTPGSIQELISGPLPSLAAQDAIRESPADFLCFDIEADGFLYNMVRAIAGTLIHVGRGRWTPQDMSRILEAGDRTIAGETAPPQGLYLMQVGYD
jgi:tRNA pseudouridine38-40 synthase